MNIFRAIAHTTDSKKEKGYVLWLFVFQKVEQRKT